MPWLTVPGGTLSLQTGYVDLETRYRFEKWHYFTVHRLVCRILDQLTLMIPFPRSPG
jgi:hypothetical protein